MCLRRCTHDGQYQKLASRTWSFVEIAWDGTSSILQNIRAGENIDLRQSIRLAIWNIMILSGTGYQIALAGEPTRLPISITGITEVRLPGSGCHPVEDSILLYSGGAQHANGAALYIRNPFVQALTASQSISARLLTARLAHRHVHLTATVASPIIQTTEPSENETKDVFYNGDRGH